MGACPWLGMLLASEPPAATTNAAQQQRCLNNNNNNNSYLSSCLKSRALSRCGSIGLERDRSNAPVLVPLRPVCGLQRCGLCRRWPLPYACGRPTVAPAESEAHLFPLSLPGQRALGHCMLGGAPTRQPKLLAPHISSCCV